MYYVNDVRNTGTGGVKVSIRDTKDGVAEWCMLSTLQSVLRRNNTIKINGVTNVGGKLMATPLSIDVPALKRVIVREFGEMGYNSELLDAGTCFSVRDLGTWEVPMDMVGTEDEEDCDFCEPTTATLKKLGEVCKRYARETGFYLTFEAGEKNYVYFRI